VGNHYLLDETQRNYLNRTVFSEEKIKSRKSKLLFLSDIEEECVLVDGYNVLITTEILYQEDKELLVDCDDGFTRDIKAVFGKYKETKTSKDALYSIIGLLKIFNPSCVFFLYDSPVSLSGELAKTTKEILKSLKVSGDAVTCHNVDGELIRLSKKHDCVVATSDGAIVDKVKKALDIPGYVSRVQK
jgi:hypothetical protein